MTIKEDLLKDYATQERMVWVAKKMLTNKRALQNEIREDMKNPMIKNAIEELKKRNGNFIL